MVSIVIPTYREAENLEELVGRIARSMESDRLRYEVIVVDDDSRDGTEQVVEKLRRAGRPVRLIVRRRERGLSTAVLRGFREARGGTLVCMDADLSHPPEAVPRLVARLREGEAEFVIGSRYVEGGSTEEDWGFVRWLNSRVATLIARPFTAARDPMAGFFALPRRVFERADELNPIGYKIGLELIVKCGCTRVSEVPIHFADRRRGESKLSLREQLNYLAHVKRLADYKFGALSQLLQFCAVGATGMVVDLSSYALLLGALAPLTLALKLLSILAAGDFLVLGALWPITVARALAIWIAMTWNFFWNRRITFSRSRDGGVLRQYVRFVIACGFGAVVNWSVSVALIRVISGLPHHVMLSAVAGILAGTVSNFVLSRIWVFPLPYGGGPTERTGADGDPGRD